MGVLAIVLFASSRAESLRFVSRVNYRAVLAPILCRNLEVVASMGRGGRCISTQNSFVIIPCCGAVKLLTTHSMLPPDSK